jgi:hypothetical protein
MNAQPEPRRPDPGRHCGEGCGFNCRARLGDADNETLDQLDRVFHGAAGVGTDVLDVLTINPWK